jgi:hypothetical protein
MTIKCEDTGKNIVVLFPMTRGKDENLFRWENLISTVNNSDVVALILIDKTISHEASKYFSDKSSEIIPDLIILQRPRVEPTHDSQSLIHLTDGLWIMQMHDDDGWDGKLELPKGISKNSIIRTNFAMISRGQKLVIKNEKWPDCRSIFSLLPSAVWNRFADLVKEQGDHVAGSIDSTLNIAVSLMQPVFHCSNFEYQYDNRHWDSRIESKRQLKKITREDGWGEFSTVDISLVARAIDGIAGLIYFNDFYSEIDFRDKLADWIRVTKPHLFKKYLKQCEIGFLLVASLFLKTFSWRFLKHFSEICNNLILNRRFLLSAWEATKIEDYLQIVENLIELDFLANLRPRFYFWAVQLNKMRS